MRSKTPSSTWRKGKFHLRDRRTCHERSLKDLDPVAYVRFASVYREFKDVNTFMDELGKLLQNKDSEKSS
jgi:hypothetical protein